MQNYIAHRRKTDQTEQSVLEHLQEVSAICGSLAGKVGVSEAGRLLGLLHDFGKYSNDFQTYIQSATGMLFASFRNGWVLRFSLKGYIKTVDKILDKCFLIQRFHIDMRRLGCY
jgi:CRISPR-associated endonuclease/helicase Cas3